MEGRASVKGVKIYGHQPGGEYIDLVLSVMLNLWLISPLVASHVMCDVMSVLFFSSI